MPTDTLLSEATPAPGALPSATPATLWECARSPYPADRFLAVRHPSCPPDLLSSLSTDPTLVIRLAIAHHPATPVPVLTQLARSTSRVLRDAILDHPSCPLPLQTHGALTADCHIRIHAGTATQPLETLPHCWSLVSQWLARRLEAGHPIRPAPRGWAYLAGILPSGAALFFAHDPGRDQSGPLDRVLFRAMLEESARAGCRPDRWHVLATASYYHGHGLTLHQLCNDRTGWCYTDPILFRSEPSLHEAQ